MKKHNNQKYQSISLSESEIVSLADTFKALGDPTRIKILLALSDQPELCVYDLSSISDVSVSATSHQLRLLRNLRLIKYRKAGKFVYYSLDDAHIEILIQEAIKHVKEL